MLLLRQTGPLEDTGGARILIGAERVLHVTRAQEYRYRTKALAGKLRSMMWELMIQHSIPQGRLPFPLPRGSGRKRSTSRNSTPPISSAEALRKTKDQLPGPWGQCLAWIDARLVELWKARVPCPGLGAALSAFGVELGTFVARAISEKGGENEDPWPLVAKMFANPAKTLPKDLVEGIGETLCKKWQRLPAERKALLQLLSRFEIYAGQAALAYLREERAEAGIDCSDAQLLANPYLLFEATRLSADPISVWTVDRGVFPDDIVRKKHPLPKPSALDTGTDARRVRVLSVNVLEDAASNGSTLMAQNQAVLKIRGAICSRRATSMAIFSTAQRTSFRELSPKQRWPTALRRRNCSGSSIRPR
jgi:hypothetical protein